MHYYRFTQYDDYEDEDTNAIHNEMSFSIEDLAHWDDVLQKFILFLTMVGYVGVEKYVAVSHPEAATNE